MNAVMLCNLSQLKVGETGRIVAIMQCEPASRQKLLAMGLTRGALISLLRYAPLGDPLQVEVRGFNLCLRKQEAQLIQVERIAI